MHERIDLSFDEPAGEIGVRDRPAPAPSGRQRVRRRRARFFVEPMDFFELHAVLMLEQRARPHVGGHAVTRADALAFEIARMIDAHGVVDEDVRMTEGRSQEHRQREDRRALTAGPVVVDQPAFHEVDGRPVRRAALRGRDGRRATKVMPGSTMRPSKSALLQSCRRHATRIKSSLRRFPSSAGSSATSPRSGWR